MARETSEWLWLAENPVQDTNVIGPLSPRVTNWRDLTDDWHGCFKGNGEIRGSESELRRFFYSNIGRRVVRSSGGIDWWEGIIVRMDWTNQGITLVRTLENLANWTKVIYTKVGDNQLANGDVEDGAWNAVGTPSTHATYTSWYARGPTSMRVVTDAANEGTQVGDGVGGADTVSVTAGVAYDCSMILDVQSGTWTLQVLDSGSNVLAQRSTGGTGRTWLKCQIPDSNTTADAACTVRLIASASGAEVYCDGATFRTSPYASNTGWYTDSSSVSEYGRAERILLEGEMTDDEATGRAQERLAELAWVRTRPPERGEMRTRQERPRLTITAYGYWWTLGWRYLLDDGTQGASAYISSLCSEAEF
ncbi:MAG: hypothetical protein GTO03_07715, partial [Planctomycetales bacterium]|nr:hypothetical protein [Planctomycetales bacterium]